MSSLSQCAPDCRQFLVFLQCLVCKGIMDLKIIRGIFHMMLLHYMTHSAAYSSNCSNTFASLSCVFSNLFHPRNLNTKIFGNSLFKWMISLCYMGSCCQSKYFYQGRVCSSWCYTSVIWKYDWAI